ncbi:hypothetical protein [Mycobacteroides abscessus]|uniref:hypothetical protein n=1 Tax=Mycobacteroides abscessus TaxID=36809 RepID=UPI0009A7E088|nr:hypothetical protein [Mycobacteroides abscessus]
MAATTPLMALLAGCETAEDKRYKEQLATVTRQREQCEAQVPAGRGLESLNGMNRPGNPGGS